MSATLQIRTVTLGDGCPRIIVPIAAPTEEKILALARNAAAHPGVDLIEWRADHWENGSDVSKTLALLALLRDILQDKPLLYTFRTVGEGGQKAVSEADYAALCAAAAEKADLIDVEIFSPCAARCISSVHEQGAAVVGSWHDFEQTPPAEALLSRFRQMQAAGADVLKIAVMPAGAEDVQTLLSAAKKFHTEEAERPMIAISMGAEGTESRLSPEKTGSCMTFAALGNASAPGQIHVDTLHRHLQSKR